MKIATLALLLWAPLLLAQSLPSDSLADRPWELAVWTGGGTSVPGGIEDVKIWNAGVRIGKVLTGEHGGGFVRGNLEYVVDLIPVNLFIAPDGNHYSGG